MRNKRRLRSLFNKAYALCLIIILVGCMPAAPTPTSLPDPPTPTDTPSPTEPPIPTDTPTETPIPPPSVCETIEAPQSQVSTNGYFLDRQMIVTGPQENIDQVIDQAINEVDPDAEAVLLQVCNLSFLSTLSFDTVSPPTTEEKEEKAEWFFNLPGSDQEQRSSLSMQLYEVRGDNVIIEQVISSLNTIGNQELFVFADPNYLTGLSQDSGPCYLPTSGGGGSGGKPWGGYGIPAPGINPPIEVQFVSQWALRGQGIVLPNSPLHGGQGIRAGVFDTAPMELLGWDPFPALPTDLDFERIRDAVTQPERPLSDDYLDGSDHGLFAAGLIHVVAPESKIHLIRVLNDEGCGTSSDLAQAIIEFINEMGTTSDKHDLQNVVMNLSLGMIKPDETPNGALPPDFVAFETAIFEAHRLGAFIFAAAGNESSQASIQNMVLPAAYDKVYGVAAINPRRGRSCFSNMGDIAAPGGDGGPDPNSESEQPCVPRSENWDDLPPPQCGTMQDCRYGVISLSLRATGSPGYIFWAGTSFATPLVTGLAARTLDKASGNPIIAECLIRAGIMPQPADPNLGMGRINVARSLASTSCP